MVKNYQYILFDWDGCLAKTLQIHLNAYKETFAEYGIYPKDSEITAKVFGDWNGPANLGVDDVATFTDTYLARVVQSFSSAALYPNVLTVLKKLSEAKKTLALVTTTTEKFIKPALKKNDLEGFFEVVLAAEDVTKHKPDAEVVLKAIDLLHGVKEQAIIIGDSKSDLGAAVNAGIDSVLFSPSDHEIFYNKQELIDTYSPTFVISDHSELLNILL